MKKTKIIATLGPASFNREMIRNLMRFGMDVARINMSHKVEKSQLGRIVETIREESTKEGKSLALLFDLCGPKIRVGNLSQEEFSIVKGQTYTLGNDTCDIPLNLELEFTQTSSGGLVKINDGKLSFEITSIDKTVLRLMALNSDVIQKGKGVNFPGIQLDLPSVTDKDREDIKTAVELGADWLAMSFVRSANDYNEIKSILDEVKADLPIIAKIEKPEAIINLGSIINSFDGILVARGDLGVEMPLQELPVLQKKIVNECLQKRKPVIIATQMLESMIHNSDPTRAEVNDIANAIYDGADAMMLSGETAIGEHPLEALQIMADISQTIDTDLDIQNFNRYIRQDSLPLQDTRGSICHAAMILANDLAINSIVIMTETGLTAMKMAQYRPRARIFALCTIPEVCYQLSLIWGITPVLVKAYSTTDELIEYSGKLLRDKGFVNSGDSFIITAGVSVGVSGSTNMLKIHQVE
ncbi:MAG: pyruvate kinase [Candidatus Marinimicrobia bacterium]|nr:pyruvate kinase [Candidatus Neomarinimicrobiota bacterium]